ncbi:Tad domain-containing protein [Petroclostridium sp. X23]|uniref:Tad domain-containing protein n=1 Tax=Petroclostridium sp. X23 TaxID=3045146 RepID=UPI0024AD6BB3|nr:Tad domain-containing protein [Petroclostridium sp. X23]WHH57947.1 Tad domain-containing protein [Petroclostridium sp. X23]
MRHKILRFFKQENGNIIILFAGTLVVLIFFIGLSLDIGMICLHRNSMQSLCQLIREDRFTYQDTIRYAENPGLTSYQIIYDTMTDNNFNGTVKVYFYEETPESNYRYYRIRTELSKEYAYTFARIFGLTTTTVTVSLDGGETYGESLKDMIWYSPIAVSSYNGSYTSQFGGGYVYDNHDIPADW